MREWCLGEIDDADLILHRPHIPQAAYFGTLPNLRAWRDGLAQLYYLWRLGASVVILRTGTPEVSKHVLKLGAKRTAFEPGPVCKARYIVGPEIVNRYMARIKVAF